MKEKRKGKKGERRMIVESGRIRKVKGYGKRKYEEGGWIMKGEE